MICHKIRVSFKNNSFPPLPPFRNGEKHSQGGGIICISQSIKTIEDVPVLRWHPVLPAFQYPSQGKISRNTISTRVSIKAVRNTVKRVCSFNLFVQKYFFNLNSFAKKLARTTKTTLISWWYDNLIYYDNKTTFTKSNVERKTKCNVYKNFPGAKK